MVTSLVSMSITFSFFRGTNEFAIDFMNCQSDWTRVINDTLSDPNNIACQDISLISYNVSANAKYVRFVAMSFYGSGPALQHIKVQGVKTSKPICFSKGFYLIQRPNVRLQ